ncbi:MAG: DUF116 domain-containing protein [Nitrospirae bacterium]|nr:DUF116 domain-containing protein [Nitrospirota bacterium]
MKRQLVRGVFLKIVFPVMSIVSSVFRINKEKVQQLVINVNNKLVRNGRFNPTKRILLLLPHCLQWSECKLKITFNVYNCAGCGKCEIKDFTTIAKKLGLELFIATGGTLARRIVADTKPEAIVAVACERDLSSGIADSYPMPVLGIINDRPYGPCFNTRVDIDKVEDALKFFAGEIK